MSVAFNPGIVTDNLVMHLDPGNIRSYVNQENLSTYSEDLTVSYPWSTARTSVGSNQGLAPNLTLTADLLIENTSSAASHYIQHYGTSGTVIASGTTSFTVSVYAKPAGRSSLRIIVRGDFVALTNGFSYEYDLSSASITARPTYGIGQNTTATMVSVGNGWYRCRCTGNLDGTSTNLTVGLYLQSAANVLNYDGDGVSGMYLWGLQTENGVDLNDYVSTTSLALSRSTSITDLSGRGSSASLVGLTTYDSNFGGSWRTDSVNDCIQFSTNLASSNTVTVDIWSRVRTVEGMIMGWSRYDVYWTGSELGFNTANSDVQGLYSSLVTTLALNNNWVHYTFVMRDNVSYTSNLIYINGKSYPTFKTAGNENTSNLSFNNGQGQISGWRINSDYRLGQNIGVVKIYNRELTATEVLNNFNALRSRYGI